MQQGGSRFSYGTVVEGNLCNQRKTVEANSTAPRRLLRLSSLLASQVFRLSVSLRSELRFIRQVGATRPAADAGLDTGSAMPAVGAAAGKGTSGPPLSESDPERVLNSL